MDMKRRQARGVSVIAIALAAGHLVQTMNAKKTALATTESVPTKIEQVAAGPEAAIPKPVIASTLPEGTQTAALGDEVQPKDNAALAVVPLATSVPEAAAPLATTVPDATVPTATPAPATAVAAGGCDVTLDLLEEANAMVGLTVISPCHPNERVVLSHSGLTVTAKTSTTGSLFLSLPALEVIAKVSVMFADGKSAENTIVIPDAAKLRRFGVQWMADDSFQIQALEDGAEYGAPGNISDLNPGKMALTGPQTGGYLSILGDETVTLPMLANVYTFPADQKTPVDVTVEAEVTDKTCGRELLGETITAFGGTVYITDLTLATPDCDAVGDILVLKNLVPDLKIAAN